MALCLFACRFGGAAKASALSTYALFLLPSCESDEASAISSQKNLVLLACSRMQHVSLQDLHAGTVNC